jgi:alkylation response protein AidB-like acyl-CoA dehydrogenase
MQLHWNDEQISLKAQFADFGRQEVAPRAVELARENAFDYESWEKLAATDFWKLIVSKEYGGLGNGWWDFTAAMEGLASAACDGGFVLTAISNAVFIRGLSLFGTPEQKGKYFPMLLRGALTATAIAEPHSGTDTSAIRTAARREGGKLLLSGEKYNIAHAPTAELTLIVGRMPELGKRDVTLFLLDQDHTGLVRGEAESKMGNRTIPTSWLRMEDIPVSEESILGGPGDGIQTLVQMASLGRIYYGLVGAQLLTPLLDAALAHVQSRESFKRPIADHQHVQRKITDAVVGIAQSRWTALGALGELLVGKKEALLTSSVAKLVGTEAFLKHARDLMSLFGSDGYLEGLASHLYQDASGWITVGGTEEMHRINIFNQLVRLSR